MRQLIAQQGEVRIVKIDETPDCKSEKVKKQTGGFIISHSESGHHHMLSEGEVIERTDNVPDGMQIFYAITNTSAEFYQNAPGNAHAPIALAPGVYEFRISREFDPFAEQARKVAD